MKNLTSEDNYQNATLMDKFKIYIYILKLFLKKQKRDSSVVDRDYNSGLWNKTFEDIDFESIVGNYHRTDRNEKIVMYYNGKLAKENLIVFEEKWKSNFLKIFKDFKNESIVELGCGLGGNLFFLRNNEFSKLEGYDISKNAIDLLLKYEKTKNYGMTFGVHDLNQEFSNNTIKNKIVFTSGCLEQCKHIMFNVIHNIIKGEPKLVINLEVNYDSSSFMSKKYLDALDYQNNLVKTLKEFEKNGLLEIIKIDKMLYALSPVNTPSIIIWKPKSKSLNQNLSK